MHAAKAEEAKQNIIDIGGIQGPDHVNRLSGNKTHPINVLSLHSSSFLEDT